MMPLQRSNETNNLGAAATFVESEYSVLNPTGGATLPPISLNTPDVTILYATLTGGLSGGSASIIPILTINPVVTPSTTNTPAPVVGPSSSISVATKGSGSAGTSSETTSGVAPGTATPSTTKATSSTTASASPTKAKNLAGQFRAFDGGAGILLLVAMLAALWGF
ncbi:MAG: hypothetical protein ASARMPREDX12_001249 [Alectoria sarmentosa]|nr:MAG: hypothetical protein ASARMPREDX12_001249 [Alectoria sarmentosa]